jgi:uncharacterized protein (TIGR03437 family)
MRVVLLLLLVTSLYGAHLVYQKPISAGPMTVDPAGNVYIFNGSGITKLDSAGNAVYSKPLSLPASAIAADSSGDVFLVGSTNADTLPTTPGVFQPKRNPGVCISGDRAMQPYPCPDAFVAKLDGNGNLAWASYLGGSNIDQANGVAVDAAGNAYVVGFTESADFPIVNAFQPAFGGYADAFVAKISGDGTQILFSSFLGGNGYDAAHAVAVDAGGNAYVAGVIQGDANRAFLIKVAASGSLVYANFLGPDASYSEGTAVAVDQQGNAYLGGFTNSLAFPSPGTSWHSVGGSPDINFVAKFGADGSGPVYSAQFQGGSGGVTSIGVDADGSAYLAGAVSSEALPIVGPAMQPCPGPNTLLDSFLVELNAAGSAPLYSSYEEAAWLSLAPDGSLYLLGSSLRKLTGLAVEDDPYVAASCVLNGASFATHGVYGQPGISPGEIVTLKGTGLGPAAAGLAGVQVLFDGTPGTVLYAQDAQINVMAPYEIAGEAQTAIQVQYQGKSTPAVTIPVSATSAAFFGNPAPIVTRGGALTLYLTGAGQTVPPSVDGQVWQTTGSLAATVSVQLTTYGSFGQVTASVPVTYAGPVPGLISGVQQVTVQIPPGLPDSFITPAFSVGSVLSFQIATQQVGVNVVVQ